MIGRIFTLLTLSCVGVFAQIQLAVGENLPAFPDPAGRAGMAAATVTLEDKSQGILIVGGANFPGRAPWDGGEKVYYSDIVLLRKVDGAWKWFKVGDLPEPVAYAAFGPCKEGLIIAGGVNATGHLSAVRIISPDGKITGRRPLPLALAYPACVVDDGKLYVVGGQTTPTSTNAEPFFGILDLENDAPNWDTRPWLTNGRMLATAGIVDGELILAGGCSLKPDAQGKPQRTYLSDTRIFDLNSKTTDRESASTAGPNLPFSVVGACGPAITHGDRIILLGADDGSHYGKPPQDHPGQRADILSVNAKANTVEVIGKLAIGCVTAPAVTLGPDIVIVSGETKPGVRTPALQSLRLSPVEPDRTWILLAATAATLVATGCWLVWRRRTRSLT